MNLAIAVCAWLVTMPPPEAPLLAPTSPKRHTRHHVSPPATRPYRFIGRLALVRHGFYREVPRAFGAPALLPELDRIVAGSGEGYLVGLRPSDQSHAWRLRYAAGFASPASVATLPGVGSMVVVSARDGILLAIDPHGGRQHWQTELLGESRAPICQQGTQLFVSTNANKVYGLDAHSGHILWAQGRSPPHRLTIDGHAAAVPHRQRVFTAFSDGFAVALDSSDGAILWERPLSLRSGPFSDADADPVVDDSRAIFASYTDGVFALDPVDGQILWNSPAYGAASLCGDDAVIWVGLADGHVQALRKKDGSPLWRSRVGRGPVSRLRLDGQHLVLVTGDAALVVLDAHSGKPLQSATLADGAAGDPQVQRGLVGAVGAAGDLLLWSRPL